MAVLFEKAAVIGTGLMGGSFALALSASGAVLKVAGYDSDPETRHEAKALSVCDEVTDSASSAVEGCGLVVLATPIGGLLGAVRGISPSLSKGTILTDVASAKLSVTEQLEKAVPRDVHYIGGHPMTGSERSGVEAARDDLYKDCYYILTPTARTDTNAYRKLHALLTSIGARVISMDPETHDKAMATVSHLPHLLSLLLMDMASRERERIGNLFTLAAGGFRDMTRIAASNPDVWIDICMDNRVFIIERLQDYSRDMSSLVDLLQRGDRDRLRNLFDSARVARRELSRKTGRDIEEMFEVMLPVPDIPGVISRITTAVGALGVNIEDIQIAHPLEGETGVMSLKILGEQNARLVSQELKYHGYHASARRV